jgi:hypothetical protein
VITDRPSELPAARDEGSPKKRPVLRRKVFPVDGQPR